MTEQQFKDLAQRMAKASGIVKLICGVGNNAAWLVVLDGYDHARKCKVYKHEVKRAFRMAIDEWHKYEARLVYAKENRMFHLDDLGEKARKTFGDISDREYYDFWSSVGGPAYEKTRPLITSLWNKHRLILVAHNVRDAEHVAWVLTAATALELAEQLYEIAISESVRDYNLNESIVRSVFGQFSLKPINNRWRSAMMLLAPDSEFEISDLERRNIQHGIQQLHEAWMNPSLLYNSTMASVEDYDEIFATRGYQKKTLKELADIRADTITNYERRE